jgi:hypothetical protein
MFQQPLAGATKNMMTQLTNALPMISSLSPITVAGVGVIAVSALLYLFCRAPEFLMVAATAAMYAAVPLIPFH